MKRFYKLLAVILSLVLGVFCSAGCDFLNFGKNDTGGEDDDTEPQTYIIQYSDDSGTHRLEVQSGMPYTLESIPKRKGYEFMGLFSAETGGKQYVSSNGSSLSAFTNNKNIVLFPQFKPKTYTLLLDYGKAEPTDSLMLNVSYGSIIEDLPLDLYAEGSEFLGWNTSKDGNGIALSTESSLTSNARVSSELIDLCDENGFINIYAVFETQQFRVKFYSYDGSELLEEKMVDYGTDIADAAPKTLSDGCEIFAWGSQSNGNGSERTGRIIVDETLYVRYFNCVLTLDNDDGSTPEEVKASNQRSYLLKDVSRAGYKFLGWDDGSGKLYTGYYTPTHSVTLKAKWEPLTYMVTFLVSEEETDFVSNDVYVTFGAVFNFPVPKSLRDDYEFDGWFTYDGVRLTNSEGKGVAAWNIADNARISGRFKKIEYTVSYNTRGGNVLQSSTVYKGEQVTLPQPTRKGYKFDCWETSSGKKVTSPYKPTESILLYARWTANKYNATFDLNGGSMSDTYKTVEFGSSFDLPVPTRSGYAFDGWFNGNTRVTDNSGKGIGTWNIDSDIKLTAAWNLLPAVVFENTIRTGSHKINGSGHYTTDTFTLAKDLGTMKSMGFTKLTVTLNYDIKEVDNCYQYAYLYDSENVSIWSERIEHGGSSKNKNWGTHTINCEISLSSLKSNIWTFKCQAENKIFKDFYIGTVTVKVVAEP